MSSTKPTKDEGPTAPTVEPSIDSTPDKGFRTMKESNTTGPEGTTSSCVIETDHLFLSMRAAQMGEFFQLIRQELCGPVNSIRVDLLIALTDAGCVFAKECAAHCASCAAYVAGGVSRGAGR